MHHVFYGLTVAAACVLCAVGVLPPDLFVELAKWLAVLYGSVFALCIIARHVWPAPPPLMEERPSLATLLAETDGGGTGVSLRGGFGSLHGDVFSDALGDGLPASYTSMIRDHDAPAVTTDGPDGCPVTVPTLDFDGMFGPKPPNPHDYNRRDEVRPPVNRGLAEREQRAREASSEVVVLVDPPKKEGNA